MATATGGVRTFVGLGLPEPHREVLAAYLADCAGRAAGFRWVTPDALHLTLRFLGHLAPDPLDAVRRELGGLRATPFRMALAGRGGFGPRATPRAVWLGVGEGLERCTALAAAVDTACQAAGVEPDQRAFRAHLTLGRARNEGERLPMLADPPALSPWVVDDLVLYESRLQQQPRYVALDRYRLLPVRG